jgi:hypothetical protein
VTQPEPEGRPDEATKIQLLRALVERETSKGTVVTKRKLRGYLEELQCPEKKIERLVDDAVAAGAVRVEVTKGRGRKEIERLLPGNQAAPAPHWRDDR